MARMTPDCQRVEATLMRIQREFLEHPGIRMTRGEAQHRFGLDAETCRTLLGVLTGARVLTMTADDAYLRFFPRHRRSAGNGAIAGGGPAARRNRQGKVIPQHRAA